MLAMNYRGPYRVRSDEKPMPVILHAEDAIVRVTRSCICGSDLHLYHGMVPDTRVGMTFGHEFCGVVEQVPNTPAEMGMRSELRHNRKGVAKKAAVLAVLGAAVFAWSRRSRRSDAEHSAPPGTASGLAFHEAVAECAL